MMRDHNQQSLKESIDKMLRTYKLKDKLDEVKLINKWEELMGKAIAKYTSKVYIRNKRLYIHITSAPLKQELSYMKDKIITILNEEIGEQVINEVIIV